LAKKYDWFLKLSMLNGSAYMVEKLIDLMGLFVEL